MNFSEEYASLDNISNVINETEKEIHVITVLDSQIIRNVLGAADTVLFIAGIVGNLLTLSAILKYPKLRKNKASWFIASLSTSDLIFCVAFLPLQSGWFFQLYKFSDLPLICRLQAFVALAATTISVFGLLLITFNRYVAIVHNGWYDRVYSSRNVAIQIVLLWIWGWVGALLPLLEITHSIRYHPEVDTCILSELETGKLPNKWILVSSNIFVCLFMLICYARIFRGVRKSRLAVESFRAPKTVEESQASKYQLDLSSTEVKLAKTMMMALLVWMASYVPLGAVFIYGMEETPQVLVGLANVLFSSSATTNFIVYALYHPQYREAYKKLLCWEKRGVIWQPSRSGGSGGTQPTEAL